MRTFDLALAQVEPDTATRWRDLSDHTAEPNPFADPRFLVPSVGTHEQAGDGRVMFVEEADAIIGALSYTATLRKVGPLRLRMLSTSESFTAFEGERFHPLVAPGRAEEVFLALIDGARKRRANLLELARLPLSSGFDEALLQAARARGVPVLVEKQHTFANVRRESLQSYTDDDAMLASAHLSKQPRKNLRRLARKLEKEHGRLELVDESGDFGAIDRFLALQKSGWKGEEAHDGKAFERTGLDAWFRAVTEAFREDGRLTVLSLRSPHRTVFTTVVLHAGRRAFGFHDAYADEFAPFSPGALGRLAEMRRLLNAHDTELFDPSMDDHKYPQAVGLYPDRSAYTSYLLGVHGVGRPVVKALPMARRTRDRMRRGRD